ncbi:putative Mitochondrial ATPase [Taphrina deformans PYCC 5710]|uniref:Mitochondrial ATPase n=1 Tax=Taphrina deformans (strain PYCC 5710 / ATCC 11124 / CBS 356.35 / IMI 108563 / JCM 9778 / NBRC 8474) TaxID=1097556 RepID=R4XC94_TAPDE|nr:putative Mitochondrial ATPase [Taphrina deformans PYCC 5710]|eukprot:CCG80950.1 putative Mitochondrial ATPase [Taphrina deformans PYCC 5710]
MSLWVGCRTSGSTLLSIPHRYTSRTGRQQFYYSTIKDDKKGLSPLQLYDRRCTQGILRSDEHQRAIINATLTRLHNELRTHKFPDVKPPTLEQHRKSASYSGIFGRFFGTKEELPEPQHTGSHLQGLYLYGDVGCGKTMLMDLFYETLPEHIQMKERIHFHAFMLNVHKRAHALKASQGNSFDAIPFIAADIAARSSVLCFDEFQVTDIVDAMILRRLLESLFAQGVVVFTTSNRAPKDLYKGGIQRVSFLPCIALLEEKLDVLCLDSATDYRKLDKSISNVYHTGLGPGAAEHAMHWFRELGDDADPPHAAVQHIWGRPIQVPQASGSCAKFTFAEICGTPHSAADYLELSRQYKSFIITDVPQLTMNEKDLARRLITLIDSLYESRTKLVITSAVPMSEIFSSDNSKGSSQELDSTMRSMMDDLGLNMDTLKDSSIFTGDEERFAFHRCLSRLSQMGTEAWALQSQL